MGLKETILGAKDRPSEQVEVPEWGVTVTVQAISGSDRDQFDAWRINEFNSKAANRFRGLRARLCALSIVEDGRRVFSDSEIDALGNKSSEAIDRIYTVARRISGLSDADVEESIKNSDAAPSGDSGLGSASHSESQPSEKPKSE